MSDTHINVRADPPRIQYIADGISTVFETPFQVFKEAAVKVFFDENEVLKESYTVTLDKERKASIAFSVPPNRNTIITIIRNLTVERTTSFQDGGSLRADILNYEFDYQMACLQQMADNLNRSMVLPPYAIDTQIKLTLPTPKSGKSIMWSEDGQSLVNSEIEINKIIKELDDKMVIATSAADTASVDAVTATQQADIATQKSNEAVATVMNKVNTDADNFTAQGQEKIVGWLIPDYTRQTTFTPVLGTVFSFPYDCLIQFTTYNCAAGIVLFRLNNNTGAVIANSVGSLNNVIESHFLLLKNTNVYVSGLPLGGEQRFYVTPLKGA